MRKFITLLLLGIPLHAGAGGGSDDLVKYRQLVMKAMASHLTAGALIARGRVSDQGRLIMHIAAIHDVSRGLAGLFPPSTAPDKTRSAAREEIWKRHAEFASAASRLETESGRLLADLRRGDVPDVAERVETVSSACTSCHKTFRRRDSD